MGMRKRDIGLRRVVEPNGVFPLVAWKLDNSREIGPGEMRVRIERIHLEWDNFQQILSSCGYKEIEVKARILDIIEKRGKLQNPFTGTGGVFLGTVEEIADGFRGEMDFAVGDKVYYAATLGAIPIHIDRIDHIDYKYGQLECSGYAICFEQSPLFRPEPGLRETYMLAALDEAGSIYSTYEIASERLCRTVAIIGSSIHTMLIYAAAMQEAIGENCQVIGIMDEFQNEEMSRREIRQCMEPLFREIIFVDFRNPLEAFCDLQKKLGEETRVDMSIITDDIRGTESVALQLTRQNGYMYFSSLSNNYAEAVLCAQSVGKVVTAFAFDQFVQGYYEFSMHLMHSLHHKMEEVDRLYQKASSKLGITKSRANAHKINATGRDDGFIYQDVVTARMVEDVMNIAGYDCNVIIQGETGVGKEKVLQLIHQNSARCSAPCVKINCATIAESLAESEFFGYEAGAFTGAQSKGKAGYFELANDGILFLDEIGTLSLNMQSKLLRVLQENQFYRVGGTRQINVNVRVICANNVPLRQLVDEGKFREDLYYRLNICTIEVPPLRERRGDIMAMGEFFLQSYNRKYGTEKEFAPGALRALHDYYWPGNVRELENVVHRLVIASRGSIIREESVNELLNESAYKDMVKSVQRSYDRNDALDFHQIMEQQEKRLIEYALKKERTTRKAADLLNLPQTTLARKKLKYGL